MAYELYFNKTAIGGFPDSSAVKNLPAMQETQIRSLGREDLLEKEMATHSSILAWRIPWTEEPGKVQSLGSQRVWHDWSNLVCNIRSTPLPLIFRVPVSWTQTAIYSLFTPWSHLLFCMLEDFCFTAGNRAEYFFLGCNLCDKLATVSSDFWLVI